MLDATTAKRELTLEKFEEEVAGGRIFTVSFFKRTDGSLRVMNCRRGVQKGVKGVGMKYDARERDLLTVYDMQKIEEGKSEKGAFRMVNLSDLQTLKHGGVEYNWDNARRVFVEK